MNSACSVSRKKSIYEPIQEPNYASYYSHTGPMYDRFRRIWNRENSVYSNDLRPVNWYPYQYPFGYYTDPSYYLAFPYWGSGYLYYRPYYQSPSGAGIINGKCVDGVAASAVTNFDNSKSNAFYPGRTCKEINFLEENENQPKYCIRGSPPKNTENGHRKCVLCK